MTVFMAFCDRFCRPICECLWHVQRIVLRAVLIKIRFMACSKDILWDVWIKKKLVYGY